MRITFAPADMAGCGYYRMIVPGLALAGLGHVVHFVSTDRAPAVWECDVLVMQRQSSEHSLELIGKVHARGVKVVHEFDDSFHLLPRDNPNFATYRNGSEHTKMMEEICRAADALIVSTPDLAAEYGKFNRRVYVCYNAFDDRQFGRFSAGAVTGAVKRAGEVRIGWAGSDTHTADMDGVRVALMKVMDEFPQVRLVFVGADMRVLFPHRVRDRMEYAGKTGIDRLTGPADVVREDLMTHRYYELIGRSEFDIGIAPLVPSSFNRMKSWLKVLEYGVLGIPCVASNHGPYRQYVGEAQGYGQVVALAYEKHEWYRNLRDLVVSEEYRRVLAENNRRYAFERHRMSERVGVWESAFAELLTA